MQQLFLKHFLALSFLCCTLVSFGQKTSTAPPLRLSCPLNEAKEVFEKQPYSLGKELKIILSSTSDTTVKAGVNGTVTNLQQDEDRKWIIVFNYKNYYFWYGGISKPLVREDQKIKAGDPLGIIAPGGKLELHFFDFETPLDPKKYLDCKW
jgi:hypothetical protein